MVSEKVGEVAGVVTAAEATEPLLRVEGLSKAFGRTQALLEATLEVGRGEVHAVLGENGAGKSTLMKILAGAQPADGGRMQLGGELFSPANPPEARLRGVAIVYQEPQLCPDLSVAENVMLGVEPTRWGLVDRRRQRHNASRALAQLRGSDGKDVIDPDTLVGKLPPGDRQMVAIARALAQTDCQVLILDEPTSSLTAADVDRLFEAVATLRDRGIAVIYISHFLEEVERIADRYTVLRDGSTVGSGRVGEVAMSEVVRLMVGSDVGEIYPHGERHRGELALELEDVAGLDKPISASLRLHRGEVVGIAGLVGSGRTELLRAVFGLDAVRSGRVRVGTQVGPASPSRRLQQGVGMLSEDRKGEGLAATMSVGDNLTLSKLAGLGPLFTILPARQNEVARRWIDRLAIRCQDEQQAVADLSGGNQQKVALGRLLYHDVDVLLLDEPTRGVDVQSRAAVYRLIDELAGRGRAVLMVSSYLPELFGVCDRIAVMRRGSLGEARPVSELDPHTVLVEATGA